MIRDTTPPTIDTAIKSGWAAQVVPFEFVSTVNKYDTVDHLLVFNKVDNSTPNRFDFRVNFSLVSKGKNVYWSYYKLTDAEYSIYDNDNSYETLLTMVANFLNTPDSKGRRQFYITFK
jgi:hypothetical protein